MEKSKIKVIVTGVTGMVGEGVLHECLNSPFIDRVLVIGRKLCGKSHPKLTEIILPDFLKPKALESQVKEFDACFFCLGVSSLGMKEADYTEKTHTLTLGFAKAIVNNNPNMSFIYVSGVGTDRTENGKLMWARVKGRTENELQLVGFKNFFAFRPSLIFPTKGLSNALVFYKYINWMYPFLKIAIPSMISTLTEVGKSMIYLALKGSDKSVIEVKDIVETSKAYDRLIKNSI